MIFSTNQISFFYLRRNFKTMIKSYAKNFKIKKY